MPSLLQRLRGADVPAARSAGWPQIFFDGHRQYSTAFPSGSLPGAKAEHIGHSFEDIVSRVRDNNGVVAAAVEARALLVSQLRFAWRDESTGRVFGSGDLAPLERPGVEDRPTLLYRAEEDACWAGNVYIRRIGNRLFRLRPDWVDLIIGSNESPSDVAAGADAEVIGYRYWPNGDRDRGTPIGLSKIEVAHFAPSPHPLRRFVGQSWVTSILRDVISDGQASEHIQNYFEHAATANMVVKAPDGTTMDQFREWVDMFEDAHAGVANAWSNIYVAAGTDVNVVGSDLAALDLKSLTGAFEARVSVRSRVHSAILGTREGMAGSALNAGNYAQIRRLWADTWFTPYADRWCAAFEQIVPAPRSFVELTYKRDRVLFLQEDAADTANIQATRATAARQLVDAGFTPESIVEALDTDDFTKLKHTGLAPVQVQPVGTMPKEGTSDASQ